jgi:putative heme-binding domain-containing protein
MGEDKIIADAVAIICPTNTKQIEPWRFTALAEMLDTLAKRSWPLEQRLDESQRQALTRVIEQARMLSADTASPEQVRASAVRLLLRESHRRADDLEVLKQLLVPQTPGGVQQAIVSHTARQSDPLIADVLMAGWKSHGPTLRAQILTVLASREAWVESLANNLQGGTVSAAEIDAAMRQRLLATKNDAQRVRLQKLLTNGSTPDRKQVIAKYQSALRLNSDTARGEAVFRKRCANCHRQGQIGHEVGPNLVSLSNKTPKTLLDAILDPSAAVEAKYLNYTVVTNEGRILTGILSSETASSIILLGPEGRRESVLRGDIDHLQSTGKSLMPDGLEKEITEQDLSDLLAFILANNASEK